MNVLHNHAADETCATSCPVYSPSGWRCSWCLRQRPMMADSEDWPHPVCDECYPRHTEAGLNAVLG